MAETVVYGSRGKAAIFLLMSLGFVAAGTLMIRDPDVAAWKSWGALIFFGLCTLIFVRQLARPNRLVIGREGFTIHVGRTHFVAWDDVERFHKWRNPVVISMQTLTGWTYKEGREPKGAAISGALGAEGALPGLWTMSTDKLVALMNERLEASRQ